MPGTRRGCGASGIWAATRSSRSPVDFGFDEAVWCPRTADEVLWTMQSYFPNGEVTAEPYAGADEDPAGAGADLLAEEGREARGASPPTTPSSAPGSIARSPSGRRLHDRARRRRASRSTCTCPTRRCTSRRSPTRSTSGKTKRGNWADILTQMDDFTGVILDKLDELGHRGRHDRRLGVRQRRRHHLPLPGDRSGSGGRSVARVLRAVARRPVHLARGVEPDPVHRPLAGEGARRARSATSSCTRSTGSRRC